MQKILIILFFSLLSLCSHGQELTEVNIDEQFNLAVQMYSEKAGYDDVKATFTFKSVDTFASRIRKFADKVHSWAQKAYSNNVKNFRKPIPGTIEYDHLTFDYDGTNNITKDYFMVPSFDVDDRGSCHLLLRGYYKGWNNTVRDVTRLAGDKNRYQELTEFNFYVRINEKELAEWVNKVEKMAAKVKQSQEDMKRTKKLFK